VIAIDKRCADGKTPDLHPAQIEAYRRMSPQEKLRLIGRTFWDAWRIKAAGLKSQHPDWTDERIADETRRIFLHGGT